MTHGCYLCTLLLIFLVCVRVRACFLCVVSKTIFFSWARKMYFHLAIKHRDQGPRPKQLNSKGLHS